MVNPHSISTDSTTLPWLKEMGVLWDSTAFAGAASRGHLEALQWLWANGCPFRNSAYWPFVIATIPARLYNMILSSAS